VGIGQSHLRSFVAGDARLADPDSAHLRTPHGHRDGYPDDDGTRHDDNDNDDNRAHHHYDNNHHYDRADNQRQHEHQHEHGHGDDHVAADAGRRLTMTRAAYAHDAVITLDPGGDTAALGGAITVALCGHWDHEPPCPLAPHHTDAVPTADGTVRLRVLFATDDEARVRALIAQALSSGRLTGPDGRVTTWTLRSSSAGSVRPDEADHAARLSR
jgi:hypothetical protein